MRSYSSRVIIAVAAVALLALSSCNRWSGGAPDFEFRTFGGETRALSSFAGTPVVLNFWADWWGPCKAEFPHFQEVYRSKSGQFELISISDSTSQNPQAYVSSAGLDWVFGSSDEAKTQYGVRGYPTTVFIDRSGKVVDTVLGGMDAQTFESKLAQIL